MAAASIDGVGMEILGEAAAEAAREDMDAPEDTARTEESTTDGGKQKRKRSTKLETAEKKLKAGQLALSKHQRMYAEYMEAGRKPTEPAVKKVEERIEHARGEVERLEKNVQHVRTEGAVLVVDVDFVLYAGRAGDSVQGALRREPSPSP